MKIKIKQRVLEEIEIEIEFPFYFKHDLHSEYGKSIIYGKKINEKTEYTIHVSKNYDGRITYEIEKDDFSNSYFEDEYKSTKEEYEKIKSNALEFLNQV